MILKKKFGKTFKQRPWNYQFFCSSLVQAISLEAVPFCEKKSSKNLSFFEIFCREFSVEAVCVLHNRLHVSNDIRHCCCLTLDSDYKKKWTSVTWFSCPSFSPIFCNFCRKGGGLDFLHCFWKKIYISHLLILTWRRCCHVTFAQFGFTTRWKIGCDPHQKTDIIVNQL